MRERERESGGSKFDFSWICSIYQTTTICTSPVIGINSVSVIFSCLTEKKRTKWPKGEHIYTYQKSF